MGEAKAFANSWWCRGGGAATLLLLIVVSVFRNHRDAIFWIAVAFFVAHTVLTVRRYLVERRHRATATVIRHHNTHAGPPTGGIVFVPRPANSILVPLTITAKDLSQQTKNPL